MRPVCGRLPGESDQPAPRNTETVKFLTVALKKIGGRRSYQVVIYFTINRPQKEANMKHIKWDEIPAERLNDKFVRKLAWDGKIMIGLTLVEQGYVVPLHAHDNEQVTFVTSGKWRFTIDGQITDVGPNEMITIPANVAHTAEAVETLVAYDIFTPPREDWINGADAYLRKPAN
jgi:quercetin dioxygenase-like cupin family protein